MELPDLVRKASPLPAPPPQFSPGACFQGVHWHQRWEIFRGVFVPGHNPVEFLLQAVRLPADLTGKRVLDIGAWNGCCSFECERRGAREVIALSLEDPEATGFYRLHRLLGSRVRYVQGSVYTLSPQELGTFDVVLFLGVLYHLRYPLLALDRIRKAARGEVFVETHVIDNCDWLRGSQKQQAPVVYQATKPTPLWRQYREFELHPGDQSNWFGPNAVAVQEAMESAGLEVTHTQLWGDRGGFRAKVKPVPERLLNHTYEACGPNLEVMGLQASD